MPRYPDWYKPLPEREPYDVPVFRFDEDSTSDVNDFLDSLRPDDAPPLREYPMSAHALRQFQRLDTDEQRLLWKHDIPVKEYDNVKRYAEYYFSKWPGNWKSTFATFFKYEQKRANRSNLSENQIEAIITFLSQRNIHIFNRLDRKQHLTKR